MIDDNTIVKEDILNDLLNELNISKEDVYNLIIWNDHVNNMEYVVIALYEVCELNAEESLKIMFDAHTNGKAVAKSGDQKEMLKFKQGLNDRNIEATVEKQ
jgi:ATP-dependent Clp protease adapter protein ClpS